MPQERIRTPDSSRSRRLSIASDPRVVSHTPELMKIMVSGSGATSLSVLMKARIKIRPSGSSPVPTRFEPINTTTLGGRPGTAAAGSAGGGRSGFAFGQRDAHALVGGGDLGLPAQRNRHVLDVGHGHHVVNQHLDRAGAGRQQRLPGEDHRLRASRSVPVELLLRHDTPRRLPARA